ncbi:MAG: PIN domain-containing protein [Methanobacteriaceae archaeon]|nr:PIN domain-containing protein [Candidatus Methanorudis spinitermitis]
MIFIDSTYFIAVISQKDQWHEKAVKLLDKIENENNCIVIDGVILETIAKVGYLGGGKKANQLYNNIKDNYIIYSTNHLYDKAMVNHLKYDGTLSLVDILIIEKMKELNAKKIISFDFDFDKIEGIVRIH